MKWKFSFTATYHSENDRRGGTFMEGEMECDEEDLPEAAVAILKDVFRERETHQTHIKFSIKPL